MSYAILRCVKEGGKLRVRIETFVGEDGTETHGVYNNKFNCQFPRNIRQEGRRFRVDSQSIKLADGASPFYRILKKDAIQILADAPEDFSNVKIYSGDLEECAICYDNPPNTVFVPCGHLHCCLSCYEMLPKQQCPICRQKIEKFFLKE